MARVTAFLMVVLVGGTLAGCAGQGEWSDAELTAITSLSLASLDPLPPDASNRVADNPAAAALGQALFFDARLSGNGAVSCASCHDPAKHFQDGTPLGTGMGTTSRRTMPIAGTAYSPWLFWDGRADSQWAQALGPLENRDEHGTDRAAVTHLVVAHYASAYANVFGAVPLLEGVPPHASPVGSDALKEAWASMSEDSRSAVDKTFANVGKAIAAFERTIVPARTRFDRYADELAMGLTSSELLSTEEKLGLRLFIGKANCLNCHNGPMFTDNHFHNTGVPAAVGLPEDLGRATGVAKVAADPFNCLGPYSDAKPSECAELKYMQKSGEELVRAYKPGSLRDVAQRPPYMHAGQFTTLETVIDHYDQAPTAPAGHSELVPLGLTQEEKGSLVAFLKTLNGEH
jgi:cytochrome c peroxidase